VYLAPVAVILPDLTVVYAVAVTFTAVNDFPSLLGPTS
jgi:hypothetical protein